MTANSRIGSSMEIAELVVEEKAFGDAGSMPRRGQSEGTALAEGHSTEGFLEEHAEGWGGFAGGGAR